MARWGDVEAAEPGYAARVRAIFTARKHHTVATLRKDGSPRVSGSEVEFRDGEMVLGMMPASVKLADVRRDPRIALQALSDDPPPDNQGAWKGDAKVAGRVVELPPRPRDQPPGTRFRVDLEEVVLTSLSDPPVELQIESWHPGRGLTASRRA
ncbi:MAG: pyridoxamine 5'-phosphate oxidase family protein [Candidatus Dormibacteria bacterium]